MNNPAVWAIIAVVGLLLLIVFFAVTANFLALWVRGLVTGARVGLPSIVFMSFRKVSPRAIVEARMIAAQAGLDEIAVNALEAHYLAGGSVHRVIRALLTAHRARIPLDWDTAAAIDLAGRDVLEAVQMSVDPRVIDCPGPNPAGRTTLDAVAKDGIQLRVQVRVTVRANLAQLVGGATQETVVARVGEGIVSAIGSAESHKVVLANPMVISHRVHEKGLDAQTAFEIVSIDIANIEVGENIGARLQVDQAEADVRVARAKAEERRARAIATEQEMLALTAENRAKLVLAEAEIPRAEADAYRSGHLRTGRRRRTTLPRDHTAARRF